MAYSSAVSLELVIEKFHYFSNKLASIPNQEALPYIERLSEIAVSIKAIDFEKDYREAKSCVKGIRDALWRAEDIIESYMLNNLLSSDDGVETWGVPMSRGSDFFQELLKVIEEIKSAKERLDVKHGKKEDYISKSGSSVISSRDELPPQFKNKMVGLDWELKYMTQIIFSERQQNLGAIVIRGMGGIGKTSLAISIYNDSDIRSHFSIVAWVKLSLAHCIRDILFDLIHTVEILSQGRLEEMISNGPLIEEIDDEGLEDLVREIFARERYLVIVDCLCEVNENSWEYIRNLLPDSNNGSRIILVNRKTFECDNFVLYVHDKCFLDQSDSWDLLRECVFGEEPCPRDLRKIGERIATNCQGLPSAIITVGSHLANEEKKTVEYWNRVAESGNSLAYIVDGALMFEQLGLSYKQLPLQLRLVYLYMSVFPEKHMTSDLELSYLWDAEGLTEGDTVYWMDHLYDRSLVARGVLENGVVSYSLHHAMWHFCCRKADEEEFFHVMDMCFNDKEDSPESMIHSNIRRLVIRKTVIFAINGLYQLEDSVTHPEAIRSLLLTGDYHPYPLPPILWDSYKKLRVLKALSICFYEFPNEILCLNLLCYLSLTLNGGQILSGISKMNRSLNVLIVHFHHIVRPSRGVPMYLPMEIWEMQQLQHLEVIGFDLPIPPPHSADRLTNLATLCGVSPQSCRTEVLERIPNLTELRIRIDLAPENDADGAPLWTFDHLAVVQQLKWLHFVITNHYFDVIGRPQVDAMLDTFSVSMDTLALLNLSGCGFPWEKIEQISKLPSLVILYLKCDAFRGPKWELTSNGFERLEILVLEELDLVHWTTSSETDKIFPSLCSLRISHCQKLQEAPQNFVHCPDLQGIDVMDSSFQVETWARSLQTELSHARRMMLAISSPRGLSSRF